MMYMPVSIPVSGEKYVDYPYSCMGSAFHCNYWDNTKTCTGIEMNTEEEKKPIHNIFIKNCWNRLFWLFKWNCSDLPLTCKSHEKKKADKRNVIQPQLASRANWPGPHCRTTDAKVQKKKIYFQLFKKWFQYSTDYIFDIYGFLLSGALTLETVPSCSMG